MKEKEGGDRHGEKRARAPFNAFHKRVANRTKLLNGLRELFELSPKGEEKKERAGVRN